MKAVILVGGEGTRLRPLTFSQPKPLLPIANQAFLERQLDWLIQHGVSEVVLALGYLPHAFENHFPDQEYRGVSLRYAVEEQPLGTAGAIRFAAGDMQERFIVCNGDVLTDLNVRALLAFHIAHKAEATISLAQVEDPSRFGVVPTRDDGEVIEFVEKPSRESAPTDWINAGTYILEPQVLTRIPTDRAVSIERETFPAILETPKSLFGCPHDGYWIDIGTPEKYLQANLDVLAGRLEQQTLAAHEAQPGVWLGEQVRVENGAEIIAPLVVGFGTRLATGARIDNAVLGPNCQVGENARVTDSVLLEGAVIGEGAIITDSIVGPRASVGDKAVLADTTVLGQGAQVAPNTNLSGARVDGEG